jgi:aspartyl-tRNA(Asn)/glutamyl-tRNA(Gln) amidotransferase subunit A
MPSARALATDIAAGRRDPVEVLERFLARIDEVDDQVKAFVLVDAEAARREAEERWRAQRAGEPLGPLHGVPVGVKDLFDVAGQHTRAGSEVPPGPPAARDAVAVARIRSVGAVVVGRTRTHEFAWGLTTQHPERGGTANPWSLERVPGGSSGGSAAAIAAGMVPLALGTDTGCSIRLPSAWCGLVGHKPTHGLVPLDGVLPLAPSLDTAGALAQDVPDARLALDVLSGTTVAPPAPLDGLRIGIGTAAELPPVADAVADALNAAQEQLAPQVAAVAPVAVPLAGRLVDLYRVAQGREAVTWHRASGRWPTHADRYGADVRARLERAEMISADEEAEVIRGREELRKLLQQLFRDVEVLLLPVASTGPSRVTDPDLVTLPAGKSWTSDANGQHGDVRAAVLPWTVLANLGGLPACSVPRGVDEDGLPIGVQIVGPPGADGMVLDVAAQLAVPIERLRSTSRSSG